MGPPRVSLRALSARPSFLLLLGAIVLAALAIYGRSAVAVSWLLVIVVASVAAFLGLRSMLRSAAEPEPLEAGGGFAGETPGELRALARTLERAGSGSAYSQTMVTARLAAAFLEKVRLTRGLSPEEIERALTDRARLRALIGDPNLAEFVYHNAREWPQRPTPPADPGAFGPGLARLLDAMEAWS